MKIWTSTPKPFLTVNEPDNSFFSRDMGLTCYALREQGVESMVVMTDSPEAKKHPDIIRTSLEKMKDSEWWRGFHLDAVVLGAWAAPRYTPIARAIKKSGAKVIIRCDSGQPYSQWQKTLWRAFYDNYLGFRCRGREWGEAYILSLLKTAIFYLPAVYEKKVIEHMACADLILNETPEGVHYLKALLCCYGRMDIAARVRYVPHPVAENMGYSGSEKKEKRIIAVGRWDSYQKNAPLLMRSLVRTLMDNRDYEAHVFGSGERLLKKNLKDMPKDVASRIYIRGKVLNEVLQDEYQKSRIFFAPSRSESFNIAAAEALACGCSFVGSGHIFSFRNFVSKNSGTLARQYSLKGMSEALAVEIYSWEHRYYNCICAAEQWHAEVSCETIASVIMNACKGWNS